MADPDLVNASTEIEALDPCGIGVALDDDVQAELEHDRCAVCREWTPCGEHRAASTIYLFYSTCMVELYVGL